MPRLVLTRHDEVLSAIDFNAKSVSEVRQIAVYEQEDYGFCLEDREPGLIYALWTGDVRLELGGRADPLEQAASIGKPFGSRVLWQDGKYFDGARGRVQIRLCCGRNSHTEEEPDWEDRVLWPVYVVSTKITEESFETMFDELRSLAGGLLFDLVSKATMALRTGNKGESPVWHYSSQLELRLLEQLWENLSSALYVIFNDPWTQLAPVSRMAFCYGSEKFEARALSTLALKGIDPRSRYTIKPFHAHRRVLRENFKIIEHKIIAGFLCFLLERLQDCRLNIKRHASSIEEDRPYRQLPSSAGASLYDTIDIPKLKKLGYAMKRVNILEGQIRAALASDCLRGITQCLSYPDTPVFRNVESYYRVGSIIQKYLNSALIVLAEGDEERLKSTSRLYEQWVFVQIAAAFKKVGLACISREGMLNRVRRYRYTLDIDRGASLTFSAPGGWHIVVRYEPWILPKGVAEQRRDTVYRASRHIAWSPDILIEFSAEQKTNTTAVGPSVEYAVVIDAKYTMFVTKNHRQAVEKYLDIRATANQRQVVRQVWVAAPCFGADSEIHLWDSNIAWSNCGPTCAKDEQVGGVLTMVPERAASAVEEGWLSEPVDVAVRFVTGLLNYVGVPNIVGMSIGRGSS